VHLECDQCDTFVAYANSHFGSLLDAHGFELVQCRTRTTRRGAAECDLVYESGACRLLLGQERNGTYAAMAAAGTPLPDDQVPRARGEDGWYLIVHLIEFKSGERLLTDQLQSRLLDVRLEQFEWLAGLLERWAPELLTLFADSKPAAWHDEFMRSQQAQLGRPARQRRWRSRWLP
jgi:hypothetical protein